MIKQLVQQAIDLNKSYRQEPEILRPATTITLGIPTLAPGVYRECSPMLKERFEMFGRWESATHGHWLGIPDMEGLWASNIQDRFLLDIHLNRLAAEQNWANEASALFKADRLSLFAGSDIGNEKIYLLWLDFTDEPELWAYDSNGESRYKDLQEYLEAYLRSDVSAATISWRA